MPTTPTLLLIAGFGDNASMFEGLLDTPLADAARLIPLDLPGFGAPPLLGETTLTSLADIVARNAADTGAHVILAHSVASIIASLAAARPDCPLTTILSLEGNLTAEDAYFSGTAADHDTPEAFRAAFLARLEGMAATRPEIARYRREVATADPRALWELGCDAKRFSSAHHPGEVLAAAASAVYLCNPENCPKSSLDWLAHAGMPRLALDGASHWASVDQPALLAREIAHALTLPAPRREPGANRA